MATVGALKAAIADLPDDMEVHVDPDWMGILSPVYEFGVMHVTTGTTEVVGDANDDELEDGQTAVFVVG